MSLQSRKLIAAIVTVAMFIVVFPLVAEGRFVNPVSTLQHMSRGEVNHDLHWLIGGLAAGSMLLLRIIMGALLSAYGLVKGYLPFWLGLLVSLLPPLLHYFTETHDVSRTFLIFSMPILFVTTLVSWFVSWLAWKWAAR